ncbi:hypothetical protein NDU88_005196 [Pleurodeles waltl]|uniref:Uncharacterized protein n=1 Tax=Pleurodeles waltl TaxID=8319 RepID=A0AAV7V564_PLEWA|nr:hypothetical protein NDU88_005196 [Pleurodeles waltl]
MASAQSCMHRLSLGGPLSPAWPQLRAPRTGSPWADPSLPHGLSSELHAPALPGRTPLSRMAQLRAAYTGSPWADPSLPHGLSTELHTLALPGRTPLSCMASAQSCMHRLSLGGPLSPAWPQLRAPRTGFPWADPSLPHGLSTELHTLALPGRTPLSRMASAQGSMHWLSLADPSLPHGSAQGCIHWLSLGGPLTPAWPQHRAPYTGSPWADPSLPHGLSSELHALALPGRTPLSRMASAQSSMHWLSLGGPLSPAWPQLRAPCTGSPWRTPLSRMAQLRAAYTGSPWADPSLPHGLSTELHTPALPGRTPLSRMASAQSSMHWLSLGGPLSPVWPQLRAAYTGSPWLDPSLPHGLSTELHKPVLPGWTPLSRMASAQSSMHWLSLADSSLPHGHSSELHALALTGRTPLSRMASAQSSTHWLSLGRPLSRAWPQLRAPCTGSPWADPSLPHGLSTELHKPVLPGWTPFSRMASAQSCIQWLSHGRPFSPALPQLRAPRTGSPWADPSLPHVLSSELHAPVLPGRTPLSRMASAQSSTHWLSLADPSLPHGSAQGCIHWLSLGGPLTPAWPQHRAPYTGSPWADPSLPHGLSSELHALALPGRTPLSRMASAQSSMHWLSLGGPLSPAWPQLRAPCTGSPWRTPLSRMAQLRAAYTGSPWADPSLPHGLSTELHTPALPGRTPLSRMSSAQSSTHRFSLGGPLSPAWPQLRAPRTGSPWADPSLPHGLSTELHTLALPGRTPLSRMASAQSSMHWLSLGGPLSPAWPQLRAPCTGSPWRSPLSRMAQLRAAYTVSPWADPSLPHGLSTELHTPALPGRTPLSRMASAQSSMHWLSLGGPLSPVWPQLRAAYTGSPWLDPSLPHGLSTELHKPVLPGWTPLSRMASAQSSMHWLSLADSSLPHGLSSELHALALTGRTPLSRMASAQSCIQWLSHGRPLSPAWPQLRAPRIGSPWADPSLVHGLSSELHAPALPGRTPLSRMASAQSSINRFFLGGPLSPTWPQLRAPCTGSPWADPSLPHGLSTELYKPVLPGWTPFSRMASAQSCIQWLSHGRPLSPAWPQLRAPRTGSPWADPSLPHGLSSELHAPVLPGRTPLSRMASAQSSINRFSLGGPLSPAWPQLRAPCTGSPWADPSLPHGLSTELHKPVLPGRTPLSCMASAQSCLHWLSLGGPLSPAWPQLRAAYTGSPWADPSLPHGLSSELHALALTGRTPLSRMASAQSSTHWLSLGGPLSRAWPQLRAPCTGSPWADPSLPHGLS